MSIIDQAKIRRSLPAQERRLNHLATTPTILCLKAPKSLHPACITKPSRFTDTSSEPACPGSSRGRAALNPSTWPLRSHRPLAPLSLLGSNRYRSAEAGIGAVPAAPRSQSPLRCAVVHSLDALAVPSALNCDKNPPTSFPEVYSNVACDPCTSTWTTRCRRTSCSTDTSVRAAC